MSAILYIARKQIINSVRSLVRRPARLVAGIASVALILWMLLGLPSGSGGGADPRLLQGGYLLWLLFLGAVTVYSSMESGSTLFTLSDVNFLFVSPLSPKKILAFGLIRQTGKTLAGFVFLLFYSGMLIDSFGVTPGGVVLLILGTVVFLVAVQVLGLTLYCWAGGSPARRLSVKIGLCAVPVLMLLLMFLVFRREGGTLDALYTAAASPLLEAVPLVGWAKGAVFALMAGSVRAATIYLSLSAALFALVLMLLFKTDADYYEDVLKGAETTFELRRSMKEKRAVNVRGRRKKKVGRTGIGRGWGANAFFYKHLCEARRSSRFVLLGSSTVILLVVAFGVTGVMTLIGSNNGRPAPADAILAAALGAGVYLLFFMSAAGDWMRELAKPYLYLVPEDPFKKLFWAGMTTVLKPALDGLVVFSVLCAALGASPFTAAACILGYAGFGFLFTAGSILGRRVLGGVPNRGAMMLLYMLLILVVIAPGVAGSIVAVFALGGSVAGAAPLVIALPCVVWNLFVSLAIFYGCRNILASSEI